MIVTEKEAASRRCQEGYAPPHSIDGGAGPFMVSVALAPLSPLAGIGSAAKSETFSPFNCIGSRCMAWEWHLSADVTEVGEPMGYCGKVSRR